MGGHGWDITVWPRPLSGSQWRIHCLDQRALTCISASSPRLSSLNPVPASSSCVMTSSLLGTPAATPCTPRRLGLRPSESSTNLRQINQIFTSLLLFTSLVQPREHVFVKQPVTDLFLFHSRFCAETRPAPPAPPWV